MPKSKVRKKRKGKQPPPRQLDPPKQKGPSPTWYIAIMFGLMAIGVIVIILNYMGLLPDGTKNLYLVIGLAMIAGGFGLTLNFR